MEQLTKDQIQNMPAGREMDALIWKYVYKSKHPKPPVNDFPSTDIDCAFGLVEKFYSMGLNKYSNGKEWRCYLVLEKNGVNQDGIGEADSAALAICRAALICMIETTQ